MDSRGYNLISQPFACPYLTVFLGSLAESIQRGSIRWRRLCMSPAWSLNEPELLASVGRSRSTGCDSSLTSSGLIGTMWSSLTNRKSGYTILNSWKSASSRLPRELVPCHLVHGLVRILSRREFFLDSHIFSNLIRFSFCFFLHRGFLSISRLQASSHY